MLTLILFLLLFCSVKSFDPATSLAGNHYNVTMIHAAGYVDMGYTSPGEPLKDPDAWDGMVIDMIAWVSKKAGFTYTLSPPTGIGPNCATDSTASLSQYAVQYNCGSDDVTTGRTDFYWSLYYITPSRLQTNIMTVPFISDVGVTLTATGAQSKGVIWDLYEKMKGDGERGLEQSDSKSITPPSVA